MEKIISIKIRSKQWQRDLIDRAADVLGKSRSGFMVEAAYREAEAVILDQRIFVLSEKNYRKVVNHLNRPVQVNRKLRNLMKAKASWEN